MTTDHPIDTLSTSAKAAWLALRYQGPLTHGEVQDETRLAKRTTSRALQDLVRVGIVERQSAAGDARETVYTLAE